MVLHLRRYIYIYIYIYIDTHKHIHISLTCLRPSCLVYCFSDLSRIQLNIVPSPLVISDLQHKRYDAHSHSYAAVQLTLAFRGRRKFEQVIKWNKMCQLWNFLWHSFVVQNIYLYIPVTSLRKLHQKASSCINKESSDRDIERERARARAERKQPCPA